MTISEVGAQYSTGLTRHNIEQALIAAGLNSEHLQRSDLGLLEDFHTMGPIATSRLTELAQVTSDDHVLDAGSGIGGTARFLADQYKCRAPHVAASRTPGYARAQRPADDDAPEPGRHQSGAEQPDLPGLRRVCRPGRIRDRR